MALAAMTRERKTTSMIRNARPITKARTNGVRNMMLSRKSMLNAVSPVTRTVAGLSPYAPGSEVVAQMVYGIDRFVFPHVGVEWNLDQFCVTRVVDLGLDGRAVGCVPVLERDGLRINQSYQLRDVGLDLRREDVPLPARIDDNDCGRGQSQREVLLEREQGLRGFDVV